MKLGIFFEDYRKLYTTDDPDTGLAWFKAQGIRGFQASVQELRQLDPKRWIPALQCHGMEFSAVHGSYRLSAADDAVFDEAVAQYIRDMDILEQYSCRHFMMAPFTPSDTAGPEDKPRAAARMAEGIHRIQEEATRRGITLWLDNVSHKLLPYSTLEDVEHMLRLCPELSCCFDTGNWIFVRQNVPAAYARLKDAVKMLHLKELAHTEDGENFLYKAYDGGLLTSPDFGQGESDMAEILQNPPAVEWCILEHGCPVSAEKLAHSLAFVKQNFKL